MGVTKQQQEEFIERLGKLARNNVKNRIAQGRKWTLPSVCIAQAVLESGWGTTTLMQKANAYFGIKANKAYIDAGGKSFNTETGEVYNGVHKTINADFRAYNNLEESVEDYFNLLCTWDNYDQAWGKTDYKDCINSIQNTMGTKGKYAYATDPNYVSKIIRIIEKYNLTRFDDVTKKQEIIKPVAPEIIKPVAPETQKPAQKQPIASDIYVVQAGDTLSQIARKYGTTYQELARINGIPNPNIINVGQQIRVKSEQQPVQNVYTVQSGDSLWAIAEKHYKNGTKYKDIKSANNLTSNTIFSGQKLILP